jgi:hypothetical protein
MKLLLVSLLVIFVVASEAKNHEQGHKDGYEAKSLKNLKPWKKKPEMKKKPVLFDANTLLKKIGSNRFTSHFLVTFFENGTWDLQMRIQTDLLLLPVLCFYSLTLTSHHF